MAAPTDWESFERLLRESAGPDVAMDVIAPADRPAAVTAAMP